MKTIQELLKDYPKLDFHNGEIYKSKKHTTPILDEEKSKSVISNFYNGFEIKENDTSGNPETEVLVEVNGRTYIEYKFAGSYEYAFINAVFNCK